MTTLAANPTTMLHPKTVAQTYSGARRWRYQTFTSVRDNGGPDKPVIAEPIPEFANDPSLFIASHVKPRIASAASGSRRVTMIFEAQRKPRQPDGRSNFNQYVPVGGPGEWFADDRVYLAMRGLAAECANTDWGSYWCANAIDHNMIPLQFGRSTIGATMGQIVDNVLAFNDMMLGRLTWLGDDNSAVNDRGQRTCHRAVGRQLLVIAPWINFAYEGPLELDNADSLTRCQCCTMWSAANELDPQTATRPGGPLPPLPSTPSTGHFQRLLLVQDDQGDIASGDPDRRAAFIAKLRRWRTELHLTLCSCDAKMDGVCDEAEG